MSNLAFKVFLAIFLVTVLGVASLVWMGSSI